MPYKKTYRKRTYKKKPFRKFRKSYRRKSTRYDGPVYSKIVNVLNITHSTTYTHADLSVNWAGSSATSTNAYARLADCNEW